MDPHPSEHPVQLRIGFQQPTSPATIELTLSGLLVLAEAPTGRWEEMRQHLAAVGAAAEEHPGGGYCFPVAHLPLLVELPEVVSVAVDDLLDPLWSLVRNPPAGGLPATLEADGPGLRLRWFDGAFRWDEPAAAELGPALLACDVAFVATPEAWEMLRLRSHLPVQAGRCRVNLDGFVEVHTGKPQLVESAPLPALFRIDDTHFGVPLAYAHRLDDAPGFSWEGPRPVPDRPPSHLPDLPFPLSPTAHADLGRAVECLAVNGGVALAWRAGLGRRAVALAAIEALDAWPALIVAPPWSVWLWQRHLEMFQRSLHLDGAYGDARVVTYLDLALGAPLSDPASILFDELTSPEVTGAEARDACRRLDGVHGAYRIGLGAHWPEDLELSCELLSLIRPGEFEPDVPLHVRYPVRPQERAREHVELYVQRHSDDPATAPAPFRRDTVQLVSPSGEQRAELSRLAHAFSKQEISPMSALLAACDITSTGTQTALAPKFAAALDTARSGVHAGMRVAVCTRSERAAQMLRQMLRPLSVAIVDEFEGQVALDLVDDGVAVVVVRFDRVLPDLRSFDWVVMGDYPTSFASLDAAVGSPLEPAGPALVVLLHTVGTVDDRLATFAAAARAGATLPRLDAGDVSYLLAPRWADDAEPDEVW